MTDTLRVSEHVLKRIVSIKEPCTGQLFGSLDGSIMPTILGFCKMPENDTPPDDDGMRTGARRNLPCEMDLYGWVKVGPLEGVEEFILAQMPQEADITDFPVFLHLLTPCDRTSLRTYIYLQGKLTKIECQSVPQTILFDEFYLLRIQCTLAMFCEQSPKSVSENAVRLRRRVAMGDVAFNVRAPASDVMINQHRTAGISCEENVESLHRLTTAPAAERDDGFGVPGVKVTKKAQKPTAPLTEYRVIDVEVLLKKSIDDSDKQLRRDACNVTIDNRNEGQTVKIPIQVDCLAMLHRDTKVSRLFFAMVETVFRSLGLIELALLEQLRELKRCFVPKCFHVLARELGHFVTCVYPYGDQLPETDPFLQAQRAALHKQFALPTNRPFFRKGNAYHFHGNKQLLLNPHQTLAVPYPDGQTAIVDGVYSYHHYMQDEFDDKGWGCAYRSLQTLISWFNRQGYSTDQTIPSHADIQKCLVRVGDKQPSFVGSRQWIGSTEVSICLNEFVGVDSRIMHVASGAELAMRGRELVHHFQLQGTPIMIGGGVLAHTILGVSLDADEGQTKFLILDPHYTGVDELGPVLSKGWCGWKGGDFWDKSSYYNLCMPQRPAMI
ncbi:ufm1-specific protease 2 [Anopheles cruzii]|uniref:ufm1-specific protease 2 n=1 Tax=Anopheles cruzii TaxID=68878 RepID=UPI0022EC46FC|nr:ufm1-specific protease 2 [Anopheles cruzii]